MNKQTGFAPILILLIVAVLALGGYFLYQQFSKQNSPATTYISTPQSTSTPTVSKKTNLNPNTGTLYGDIKVRLNEVLK